MTGFLTVFLTIFFAELGDKTQFGTLLFASDQDRNPWLVFLASACALVLSSALAVSLGAAAERWLTILPLKLIAGIGFFAIGAWMVFGHFSADQTS